MNAVDILLQDKKDFAFLTTHGSGLPILSKSCKDFMKAILG